MLEDVTGARVPFSVLAGAPNDALFIAANGKIGLRTATPLLDMFDRLALPAVRSSVMPRPLDVWFAAPRFR